MASPSFSASMLRHAPSGTAWGRADQSLASLETRARDPHRPRQYPPIFLSPYRWHHVEAGLLVVATAGVAATAARRPPPLSTGALRSRRSAPRARSAARGARAPSCWRCAIEDLFAVARDLSLLFPGRRRRRQPPAASPRHSGGVWSAIFGVGRCVGLLPAPLDLSDCPLDLPQQWVPG